MKPIWIVDDDQSIRFVLEKALLRENLPTRSFTNPKDVITALNAAGDDDGPQILVSDIRMPGGSGLDLLERVKAKHPGLPVIAFPREAGAGYIGFANATGADCVAIDNSVSPEWAAENVQSTGCVQGNLSPTHMVTGGQDLIDATRRVKAAFQAGPHIFNLGHGITPDADPENVALMVETVRGL